MHAGFRQEDRETWPTIRALKRQMEDLNIASARRVHDMVQRLVDVGFVDYLPLEKDGRVKVLTPTFAMLALDRQMLAVYFRPLSILYPENRYLEPLEFDPVFQRSVRKIGPAFMALFQEAIQANTTINFFLPRQGGLLILLKLMQISLNRDIEQMPEISFVELGDYFGISRTHVRRILKQAARADLVTFTASGMSISRACRAGFDRFVADTMRGHDFIYWFAKGQHRLEAPAP